MADANEVARRYEERERKTESTYAVPPQPRPLGRLIVSRRIGDALEESVIDQMCSIEPHGEHYLIARSEDMKVRWFINLDVFEMVEYVESEVREG